MRSVITSFLLMLLFAALFGSAVFIQHRGLEAVRNSPPFYDTWQLTGRSGDVLRVVSLRYDLLVADFLWLRAIQSFGGRGMTNRDYKPLYNMFDTITELDPYFEAAYTFGNLVVGDEGGHQKEGLELLHKGTFNCYRQYRIPFEGMYVANWELNDTQQARWYGRLAMKRRDAPDWIPRIVAYIEVKSGAYYLGFDRFLGSLLSALDTGEPTLEAIALSKAKETLEKWNLSLMSHALDEYTSTTGKQPLRIEDIASMPSLQNYEVGSMSKMVASIQAHAVKQQLRGLNPAFLTDTALPTQMDLSKAAPQTTFTKSANKLEALQNEIFKESLVKRSGIPEDPYGSRYVLNPLDLNNPEADPGDRILNVKKLEEETGNLITSVRQAIQRRKTQLGRNPTSLHEVFYTDFKTTEPFGGQWTYDPKTAEFHSSTHPEL